MAKFLGFILKRPGAVLIVFACITIFLAAGLRKLEFDNSMEIFMPRQDKEYEYYQKIKNIYGENEKLIVSAVSCKNLFTNKAIGKIDNLISELEEYKEFNEKLENHRIKKYDSIKLKAKDISCNDLINKFDDDPIFGRMLKRKIEKSFGRVKTLSSGELSELREAIVYSYKMKKLEMVDEIVSPLTMKDIIGRDDTLETYDLVEKDENGKRKLPETKEEITVFRKKLERNPSFERGIYSRDPGSGKITDFGIIIKFIKADNHDRIARELKELFDSHSDLTVISHGIPVANITFNDYMRIDIIKFSPIVMLIIMLIFYLNFRSLRGMLLPFITLVTTVLWVFGLMGHLGFRITVMGVTLPSLLIAVGSSYSIHILNQYYIDFSMISEKGRMDGLRQSMTHISVTVLLAGLTTFIGFASLTTHQLTAMREWGIFSAIGVLFAAIISIVVLPASFALLPHRMPRLMLRKDNTVKRTFVDSFLSFIAWLIVKHSKKVLIASAIILIISISGIFSLKVETSFMSFYKEDDPIRTNATIIGKKLGGSWGINILIDSGKMDGIKTPEFLNAIEKLRRWLESDQNIDLNIGRTDSFNDFIKTMHMAMNNDDILFYKIPENRMDILDYLELYSGDDENSDGRIDEFEPFVDQDFRTCNLFARLWDKEGRALSSSDIKYIINKISGHMKKNLPIGYTFRITGDPSMTLRLVHYIVSGQLISLLLCLIVVGIIIMLLFKNIKAGPIALIDIGLSVIINFGIMGWFGINLDVATAIIASVTIGIGVDDTIHFLNTFRYNREKGYGIDEIIKRTLKVSGKAIFYTSFALMFGFLVLTLSNFRPLILVGLLSAITMITTLFGSILVIPAVIKTTGVDLSESQSDSKLWKYLYIGRFFGID